VSDNPPVEGKPIPSARLKALLWARFDMQEAHAACIHLLQLGDLPVLLHHALVTGIVVCYSRPFAENTGLSNIAAECSVFPTKIAEKMHRAILEARDHHYAHNNRIPRRKDISSAVPVERMNDVVIVVQEDGHARALTPRIGFSSEQVAEIGALCEYQIERLTKSSSDMLEHFSRGKEYTPGEYLLGLNFP
jgi:hypothetical protein